MNSIERTSHEEGLDLYTVLLDGGFTIRIILPSGEEDIPDEYVVQLAEQRRTTRLSFTAKENTKRGYLTGVQE